MGRNIMIKIIWTYNKNIHSDKNIIKNIEAYYKRSIYDAKSFGHSTELYSNDKNFKNVPNVFNYTDKKILFWDEFKTIPLHNTKDDFLLADGDIIWHQPFNLNKNVDVLIDSYEVSNWKSLYEIDVNTLSYLGIDKVIPEWDGKKRAAFCTGILCFNNKDFQLLYLDRYFKFKSFVEQYKHMLDINKCTYIAAQYLLATIADVKGFTHYAYSKVLRENNGIYTHYAGDKKINDSFLPNERKYR